MKRIEAKLSKQLRDDFKKVYSDCVPVLLPDMRRTQKKMYDFHIFLDGKCFCIELKQCEGNSFNIRSKVYEHQFEDLEQIRRAGISAFFVIIFNGFKKGVCISPKELKETHERTKSFGWQTFGERVFERKKIDGNTRWQIEKITAFAKMDNYES